MMRIYPAPPRSTRGDRPFPSIFSVPFIPTALPMLLTHAHTHAHTYMHTHKHTSMHAHMCAHTHTASRLLLALPGSVPQASATAG